jgi:hypothetical protein
VPSLPPCPIGDRDTQEDKEPTCVEVLECPQLTVCGNSVVKVKPGYRPQSEDTSIEVDVFEFGLLRQRTPQQRLQMSSNMMLGARRLSLHCLKQQFSYLAPLQFVRKVAETWLQEDCPKDYLPSGSEMTWIQDSIGMAALLHPILTQLNIPYYITGGVAAIAYGEPRTTRDLDMVLAIARSDIEVLAALLEQSGFYVPGVEDVVSGRMTTLQVTHIESIFRADLMIASNDEFNQIQFERRRTISMPGVSDLYFASPEDVILNKLRWGKASQSEKQWRDVLGVLKVQREALDFAYLIQWALQLGLEGDLGRAFIEAGL